MEQAVVTSGPRQKRKLAIEDDEDEQDEDADETELAKRPKI